MQLLVYCMQFVVCVSLLGGVLFTEFMVMASLGLLNVGKDMIKIIL